MPEVILSDYFYGDESEEFIYFKIPRLLITDQKFKHVSTDAKLLYGMLLDRMGLSAKNDWYDDYGRVYIYYTIDEIGEDMCCGRDKAMKLLAELDKKKGIGLIERVKQGQGRPTKLYVKRFTTRTAPSKPAPPPPDDFMPCPDVEKNHPKTSEKSTSRRRKKPPQEVGKIDPNQTKRNHPDFNHPDLSIAPQSSPGSAVGMDRYEQREEVKANMAYETDERIAELTERLENGIMKLYASDSYAQYIAAMTKFHQYRLPTGPTSKRACPRPTYGGPPPWCTRRGGW